MLFSGIILFIGSIIWVILYNKDNPLHDDLHFILPFNKLFQLAGTVMLGFSLILVATSRIFTGN